MTQQEQPKLDGKQEMSSERGCIIAKPSGREARRSVMRTHVLRDMDVRGSQAGITLVIAPDGFGKTTVLHQRVAAVRADRERGVARLLDAGHMDAQELFAALKRMRSELGGATRPLVAIDDCPRMTGSALEAVPALLRAMREEGFEFLVACSPTARDFLSAMGDTHVVRPAALLVRPHEYDEWAKEFAIARDLDVYELTQGIPRLVALLGEIVAYRSGSEAFAEGAADMYRRALDELRRCRDSLYRLACLLILTGAGRQRDFERIGMRPRRDTWLRMARDYPMFGIDIERGGYRCLAMRSAAMEGLCREIVARQPLFAARAVSVLLDAGNVDRAVSIASMFSRQADALGVLAEHPTAFALSGNVDFVRTLVGSIEDSNPSCVEPGVVLSMLLAGLVSGDYRTARGFAAELRRRAHDALEAIEPMAWAEASALCSVWSACRGIELPSIDPAAIQGKRSVATHDLQLHVHVYRQLVEGAGVGALDEALPGLEELVGTSFDVPKVLLACDRVLVDSLRGDIGDARALDDRLQAVAKHALERCLNPIAMHVRMVAAFNRLLMGLPVTDERAFVDAGTIAVRTRELPTQLLCLVGEGWQALAVSQTSNALFRAQQVLKLADEKQVLLTTWARLLECCAHVMNASCANLSDEVEFFDLSQEATSFVDAWVIAITLSAAHRVGELTAWCSLNKRIMLAKEYSGFARQTVAALGDRVVSLARLLPQECLVADEHIAAAQVPSQAVRAAGLLADEEGLGHVRVSLFGGFQVERNGHVVTGSMWRRRKACVLAARLVLAGGTFVLRSELRELVWPHKDYQRAREALYTCLTSLRAAFGQTENGPQYVITQGEGVAVNSEYVTSDVMLFDRLARDILLRRSGTTGRQLIEACLALDELYAGPLYVPTYGDAAYFVAQRKVYEGKFIDCMMRGIAVALEMEDLPAASWFVEAALRRAPLREDVIRAAMRIYDMTGRRREVVELYTSHMHVLEQELHALPERETQLLYESIIQRAGEVALIA